MKNGKLLLLLSLLMIPMVTLTTAAFYMGALSTVEVKEVQQGPFYLVYKEHEGDYRGIGNIVSEVKLSLDDLKIKPLYLFGIYYDNPKYVEKEKLRSDAGCVVTKEDLKNPTVLSKGFKTKELPVETYLTAKIEFKNPFSIFVGIFKAYPAINEFAAQKGYILKESMELYDDYVVTNPAYITYLLPVRK